MYMPTFPQRLRQLRRGLKMTQGTLADKVGVSKSSIAMYERGEREPSVDALEAIASALGVSLDYLRGKSDTGEPAQRCNTIRIAGRDGSFVARSLTDEQVDVLMALIAQLPDAQDDI